MNVDVINSISKYQLPLLGEHFLPALTAKHKKILMIALLAFTALAVGCKMIHSYFKTIKAINLNKDNNVLNKQKNNQLPKDDKEIQAKERNEKYLELIKSPELIYESFPENKWFQIAKSLNENISFSGTKDWFKKCLLDPKQLVKILDLDYLSPILPFIVKFDLALRCGKELVKMDFSTDPDEFDDEKLNALKEACPNLETLILRYTKIRKLNLPEGLINLNLNDCPKIRSEELEKLALTKLKRLSLGCSKITKLDCLPESLIELDLEDCEDIEHEKFEKLPTLRKLKKLSLKSTKIRKLDYLPPDLKELDLSYSYDLESKEFEKLATLFFQLEKLNVSCKIKSLSNLPKTLIELTLSDGDDIEPQEYKHLARLPKLKKLFLNHAGIQTLSNLPRDLKELELTHCGSIEPQEFKHLARLRLEKLTVWDGKIQSISNLPKSLKEISLQSCKFIEPQDLNFNHFLHLVKLDFDGVNKHTISKLPQSLKEIKIINCKGIEPPEFEHLVLLERLFVHGTIQTLDKLPQSLNELWLIDCNIGPQEFEHLARLSNLKKLVIRGGHIQSLESLPQSLRSLTLIGCNDIQSKDIEKLKSIRKDLIVG